MVLYERVTLRSFKMYRTMSTYFNRAHFSLPEYAFVSFIGKIVFEICELKNIFLIFLIRKRRLLTTYCISRTILSQNETKIYSDRSE